VVVEREWEGVDGERFESWLLGEVGRGREGQSVRGKDGRVNVSLVARLRVCILFSVIETR